MFTPLKIFTQAVFISPLTDRGMLNALRGVTGVYVLLNTVNGKYYIGSSFDILTRIFDYLQPAYQASRSTHPIIRALLKYGADKFVVLVLSRGTRDNVREQEQAAIDSFAPAYNQLKTVDSSAGYKHTPETRALLSTLRTGTKRSQESREQQGRTISGSGNHRSGTTLTQEQKDHLRLVALARTKSHKPCDPICVEHTDTGVINTYRSVRAASNSEPYTRPALTAALKGTKVISNVRVYYAPTRPLSNFHFKHA